MKKIQPLLALLILFSGILQSQDYEEVLRNVFYEAEYWLLEEAYPDALVEYQKLYTRGYENNANINYRMGICYLNIPGEKTKAIPYLQKAVENVTSRYKEGIFKETKAPNDAWLFMGNAYRITNELDKAIECYNTYIGLVEDEESEMVTYAQKQIEASNNAKKAIDNPAFYIRKHCGEVINTGTSDFNPVVSADESTMVYMTALKFYNAINITHKENGEWATPKQITAELEPEGKLYANSISNNGTELYLNQEDNFNSDIYISTIENDRWQKAKPLGKLVNTKFWESHASISPDGKYLYLTSNRKDGQGGMDIWVSEKGELEWGEPQNLGAVINTDLNEDHPFITQNGKMLYFASQGHFNIGGYDIFYSEKQADGSWGEPKNLGYPLNTTDDDLFFVPLSNGKYGYQAIFSEENVGSRDIHRFERFDTEAELLAALALMEKEETEAKNAEEVKETVEETQVVEAVLEPVVMYVIRPVFFGFDKSDLTAEAKATLDDLIKILEVFPSLEIQAIGHTDHKGPDGYNLMLSKKRSASVLRYISQRGINASRIQSLGKGENQPVARNSMPDGSDSPEGRQLNRRVEILVVKPDLPNIKVEEIQVPIQLRK